MFRLVLFAMKHSVNFTFSHLKDKFGFFQVWCNKILTCLYVCGNRSCCCNNSYFQYWPWSYHCSGGKHSASRVFCCLNQFWTMSCQVFMVFGVVVNVFLSTAPQDKISLPVVLFLPAVLITDSLTKYLQILLCKPVFYWRTAPVISTKPLVSLLMESF